MTSADQQPRPIVPQLLKQWRCWKCGALLARLSLMPGCTVEVKCASCKAMNTATLDMARAQA